MIPARTLLLCTVLPLAVLPLAGCSLFRNDKEEEMLIIHKRNAKVFYEDGQLARAEDQCRRGLEIDEDDKSLRLSLAYTLYRQADAQSLPKLAEAVAIFDDLTGWFTGDDYRVYQGWGMALNKWSRLANDEEIATKYRKEAREHLEKALVLEGESIDAAYELAILDIEELAEGEDRNEEFLRHSDITIELIKISDRFAENSMRFIQDEANLVRAQTDQEINRQRARRLLDVRVGRAFENDDFLSAKKDLETLAELGELGPVDHYNRAQVREAVGDLQGAVEDYEQFVLMSATSSSDQVSVAVRRLTELRSRLAELRVSSEPDDGETNPDRDGVEESL